MPNAIRNMWSMLPFNCDTQRLLQGVLVCCCLFFAATVRAEVVVLTDTEKQWLAEHPHITMAMVPSWQPISMRDGHGQLSGLAGDYKSILEQRLGIQLELAEEW